MRLLWQQIANTTVSRILCSTNMDGIVLDCEHGYFNPETLVNCIEIIKSNCKMCFIRTKYDEQRIQLAYDNKCNGVIISTVTESFYKSHGVGLTRRNFWGRFPISDCGRDWIIVAQIENMLGFARVLGGAYKNKTYQTLRGYDYYMLTHYDFKRSAGEMYRERVKEFCKKIPTEKRAVHHICDLYTKTGIDKYKDYGLQCFSLDTLMILDAIKELDKYA